jgi:hypothetical protein
MIKAHYMTVQTNLKGLDTVLDSMPSASPDADTVMQKAKPTAVLMVGSYAGLGVHSLLTIQRLFPKHFENFIFLSVGVIDSASFTNVKEVDEVQLRTEASLARYVALAHGLGLAADSRMSMGTEAVAEAEKLCATVGKEFPRAVFFAGKLVFEQEHWYQRILHNESAYQIQRRLQFEGLNCMVLPVRILAPSGA